MNGRWQEPISEPMKEQFLDLTEEGYSRVEAAEACGSTARKFRALCNPESPFYDENFQRVYDMLMVEGGKHQEALRERLEAAAVERGIEKGSDRILEKLLMAYHPDFHFLRPVAGGSTTYNVDNLVQLMPGIPTHILEEMKQHLVEQRKQKELPTIDA